jgi:uncharacterized protein
MHEDVFNIVDHKGNAIQNYSEFSSPSQIGNHQEHQQRMLVRMWGKEPSSTAGGSGNWRHHRGNPCEASSKELK